MTKFKAQALHIIRIKHWKASGSGNPLSLIPILWNIGILIHKQATHAKHFGPECILFWKIIYFIRKLFYYSYKKKIILFWASCSIIIAISQTVSCEKKLHMHKCEEHIRKLA